MGSHSELSRDEVVELMLACLLSWTKHAVNSPEAKLGLVREDVRNQLSHKTVEPTTTPFASPLAAGVRDFTKAVEVGDIVRWKGVRYTVRTLDLLYVTFYCMGDKAPRTEVMLVNKREDYDGDGMEFIGHEHLGIFRWNHRNQRCLELGNEHRNYLRRVYIAVSPR